DRLVPALARLADQRCRRLRHFRAPRQPLVHLLQIDPELGRLSPRVVEAQRLDVLTAPGRLRVRNHQSVARLLLPANAPEADSNGHVVSMSRVGVGLGVISRTGAAGPGARRRPDPAPSFSSSTSASAGIAPAAGSLPGSAGRSPARSAPAGTRSGSPAGGAPAASWTG